MPSTTALISAMTAGAVWPPMPLPASMAILMGRSKNVRLKEFLGNKEIKNSTYEVRRSRALSFPTERCGIGNPSVIPT